MSTDGYKATELPDVRDNLDEEGDHGDETLTLEEAAEGDAVYHEVDDLDDNSNGMDEGDED